MAQLQYNDIREKKIIIYSGEPCQVVESHVARTQQRKPQNQVKLKSLISGKTFAATFHVSDKAEEAEVEKEEIKFLYSNRGEFWFCEKDDPSKRFKLESNIIDENTAKFLKENSLVEATIWDSDDGEQIIQITLPIKMEFKVKEAPPAVKGNTAQGGNKIITLENGTKINTPMFIEPGDTIGIKKTHRVTLCVF
jgi:elongation factor P